MKNATGNKRQLLLVEDDVDMATMLALFISRMGIEVSVRHSGGEALDYLKDHAVDVVLSDITMPGMSGLKLLSRCHALGYTTPFVFLTGYGHAEVVIEAVRLGAVDFLCKPCQEDELLSVLKRSFAISERQQAIDNLVQQLGEGVAPKTCELLEDLRRQISLLRVLASEEGASKRSA